MCRLCFGESPDIIEDPGAVAQLVERLRGTQKAGDSSSPSSTLLQVFDQVGYTLGGLVAAEGSFIVTRQSRPFADGRPRLRFVLQVSMAERDRPLLAALRALLGFGTLFRSEPVVDHWLPKWTLTVASFKAHRQATIPFSNQYLLESCKRREFEQWRNALLSYQPFLRPRERSLCSVEGCDRRVRGRGLCRSHYYQVTGY